MSEESQKSKSSLILEEYKRKKADSSATAGEVKKLWEAYWNACIEEIDEKHKGI